MKNLKKEPSVEDLLRQQIEKQEFYEDDGGSSGGNRPGGGDGDSGGTDDEGLTGILDELLQVILATLGFIFLVIYVDSLHLFCLFAVRLIWAYHMQVHSIHINAFALC